MECCLPLPAGLAPPSWRGRPRQTVPHPTKSVAAAISVELLDGRRACFETPASRAPQHEVFLCVTRSLPHASEKHGRAACPGARLEGRGQLLQRQRRFVIRFCPEHCQTARSNLPPLSDE